MRSEARRPAGSAPVPDAGAAVGLELVDHVGLLARQFLILVSRTARRATVRSPWSLGTSPTRRVLPH